LNNHDTYIKRCIELAKNGLGTTAPNPMVGCVIVHNSLIIGEGYTCPYGGNHAEVNAIESVKNKSLLAASTLYVTLEPCSHYGKTPPCADLIITHKIPSVIIGCIDIHDKVAGKGVEKLQKAGCEVLVGVLEKECKAHHKRFFTYHHKKRPYIILKWAETADGFIAPLETERNEANPVWITNRYSRQLVHKWRSEEQAILVGTKTALIDNPSLTTRDWKGKSPVRIVLDRKNKIPTSNSVKDGTHKTLILVEQIPQHTALKENCIFEAIDYTQDIASQICTILYAHQINSVIIEGGAQTLQTFIDAKFWDEARVFTSNTLFKAGINAPAFKGKLLNEAQIIGDTLKIYGNHD
jgi:diaminohydroxyphosphoribosylaminopyrimidine deaminase/5-amino-6-(5-phosphoribosylamino)uracil reductase